MKRPIALAFVSVSALAIAACGSSSSSSTSPTTAAAPGGTAGSSATTAQSGGTNMNTGNPSSPVTLTESGSSLEFPYLQVLADPLHSAYSNITLAPAAGGSGKGISDATAGTTDLGGSDAYLSSGQLAANTALMNIPIVVSSQAVDYNIPGVKTSLKLTGDVLAQIYMGKITKWNDPAIASLNTGVTLPSTTIVPVRRVDSSGDTFIFTSFLSKTNSAWNSGPAFGTTVTWPAAPGELTANGNPGMVQTCSSTPGCIAYVGISSQAQATSAGLGEALLQNQAGQFVSPTQANVTSAVNNSTSNVPDNLAASLIYAAGATSYPIVNFEYLVVKSTQSDANKAKAIRTFLAFAIDPSQGSTPANLAKEQFVALPSSVIPKVQAAIAKIGS
ncbi:phosphate ABC transporter substrate-binding protein PstS [Acidiferrimicrobium sp. IK]|uniref:phosphate ABC transporter substrate-binding protein PstS n=1 Tax=Acidiferrimicrobium sp. IK TaxID=2871700 RepID=UPI0021CB6042|nr:phosphate ABC transporter substrate-binding protein PstS [Acidiferrimicrobium sp. IK]MCU4185093.1 phosphate ABC transporter substrate-binding protein PstS [Acidiferrimicrobium sp. IK]